MQAEFRFVNENWIGFQMFGLVEQSCQADEAKRAVGQLTRTKRRCFGTTILEPFQFHALTYLLAIGEILEERRRQTHCIHDSTIVFWMPLSYEAQDRSKIAAIGMEV